MRIPLATAAGAFLERHFPERRIFLSSDADTRFLRLRPATQLFAFSGAALVVGWAITATAILLIDSIGSGSVREQARRDQHTYEQRLNALSSERDIRSAEAREAQERFNSALDQISLMQSELLASETRRREMETGISVIQTTLRRTMRERDAARSEAETLIAQNESAASSPMLPSDDAGTNPVDFLTAALADTAAERDKISADAQNALIQASELEYEIRLMQDQNDQIFRQIEDAMTISVEPLDKMFRAAGLNTDKMLDTVRKGYSGQGGPLMPLSFSTRGEAPSPDEQRANAILNQMDRLNLYRITAEKAPFALPLKDSFRYTSGFGPRWGRMHSGTDMAGAPGTPIYATADGVVTYAGWQSGYGRLVTIQHAFGIETRYAHQSKIRVKKGQRVSRGDHIGDMGNSGRSTGTHLHYEIRVNGTAVNAMTYIKAARDVF